MQRASVDGDLALDFILKQLGAMGYVGVGRIAVRGFEQGTESDFCFGDEEMLAPGQRSSCVKHREALAERLADGHSGAWPRAVNRLCQRTAVGGEVLQGHRLQCLLLAWAWQLPELVAARVDGKRWCWAWSQEEPISCFLPHYLCVPWGRWGRRAQGLAR